MIIHIKLSDCLVHKGEILRNNIHVLKDKKLLLIICHPKIIFSFISHKSRQVCWNCRKVLKYIFVRQPVTVNLLSLFSDSYDVRETSCNATQILTYKTDNVTAQNFPFSNNIICCCVMALLCEKLSTWHEKMCF